MVKRVLKEVGTDADLTEKQSAFAIPYPSHAIVFPPGGRSKGTRKMKKLNSQKKMAALLASTALVAAACGADTVTDSAEAVVDEVAEVVEDEEAMEDEEEAMEDEEEAMEDEDDDETSGDDADEDTDATTDQPEELALVDDPEESLGGAPVALEFSGLEPLGEGFVYEGWIVVDGSPVSTGRFTLEEIDGERNYTAESLATQSDLDNATDFVLSIEPAEGDDPAPADPKPLAGAIVDGVAELSIAHPAALGDDFSSAAGQFILTTPTTEATDDDYSGVWFIEVTNDGPVAGLDLPELPAGWVYEGWVVIDGQPISTGRFVDPGAIDDFNGFSGELGNPPFPGEDFVVNAPAGLEFPTNLADGNSSVVISIEPEDDDSPAPFAFKPLATDIAEGTAPEVAVELGTGPAFPTGSASIG